MGRESYYDRTKSSASYYECKHNPPSENQNEKCPDAARDFLQLIERTKRESHVSLNEKNLLLVRKIVKV